MTQRQNKCTSINRYVQLNISKPFRDIYSLAEFLLKMAKMTKTACAVFRQVLNVYVSSFCCWVNTVMETTSNPWSVGKP